MTDSKHTLKIRKKTKSFLKCFRMGVCSWKLLVLGWCCLRSSCCDGTFGLVINTLHLPLWGTERFWSDSCVARCDQSQLGHGKCDSLAVRSLSFLPHFSVSWIQLLCSPIYSSLFVLKLKANNAPDELYKVQIICLSSFLPRVRWENQWSHTCTKHWTRARINLV